MSAKPEEGIIINKWEEDIVTIQFRAPRWFRNAFQDWCENEGVTMSAAIISFVSRRAEIGLPPSLVKPWKDPNKHPNRGQQC